MASWVTKQTDHSSSRLRENQTEANYKIGCKEHAICRFNTAVRLCIHTNINFNQPRMGQQDPCRTHCAKGLKIVFVSKWGSVNKPIATYNISFTFRLSLFNIHHTGKIYRNFLWRLARMIRDGH